MLANERLQLFPITVSVNSDGEGDQLAIGGLGLGQLADEFGTPLYVYDQATMDDAIAQYRCALAAYYPGDSSITFAGKAFLCLALAQWVERRNIWLDCTGRTELLIATTARVNRSRILVHGVNKSAADLEAAASTAGVIVVDNLGELLRLEPLLLGRAPDQRPDLWIRIRPGHAVDTHVHNQTGQEDSKFGMSADEAAEAVRICRERGLPLTGIHFHQGSHFHDPVQIGPAIDKALDLIASLHQDSGWMPTSFSNGGGWGVPYHENDLPHPSIEEYVRYLGNHLAIACQTRNLPLPHLHIEPGRSIVARAGVALYRVGTVKSTKHRRWILIDGGLADNPRTALYDARYSALPVRNPQRADSGPAWIAGPYCESGDILIKDLPMPAVNPGDLIAVPVSGAYQLAMGSNYNGACKPAIVWVTNSHANLIQRRQLPEDLVARDVPLPDE